MEIILCVLRHISFPLSWCHLSPCFADGRAMKQKKKIVYRKLLFTEKSIVIHQYLILFTWAVSNHPLEQVTQIWGLLLQKELCYMYINIYFN